ncbi:glycosyl transferase family 2 [Halopiger xanaduensis]|uniref:Cell wall biogenesis glycosyltransferase n=1 Tax=Halopiger xanaduensis (strain DSM 18323 / JCM 14033 / SH-6) TaxID=797210 RepID=F8D4A8_HALXS|nr:glycosyl transferase family 2 [Halopiger xanaduensis]AEH38648.1 cell wall biogenesis glycosyltransferase [Halopiger xanaduensis SH-6]
MEYVQERIATLHEFGDAGAPGSGAKAGAEAATADGTGTTGRALDDALEAALPETAVIVPMTDREHENPAAERVLSELEALEPAPAAVFAPVRADADRIEPFRQWLESFSLPIRVLWCNAPAVDELLADAGLAGEFGKGRDVWLALGPAAEAGEYVVVHDADARSYEADHVRRLLAPLTMDADFEFAKGYYARIEDDRLYGRLFRLFYEPLLRALAAENGAPILEYLRSFRYALAGEFAMTAALARRLRAPRAWGLEVGTLGDAFAYAGFEGTAQVDLGRHVHDHRAVAGDAGLEGMSREVAAELLRVLEEGGVDPDYGTLPERYRAAGEELVEQYRVDAAFNGLEYDPAGEREQIDRYADSIAPPGPDRRLPRWTEAPFEPAAVVDAARPWVDAESGTDVGSGTETERESEAERRLGSRAQD